MKIIAIQEPEIKAFIDSLKLRDFQLKTSFDPEVTDAVFRKFHYEVVNFFQKQGSSWPSE